MKSYARIALRLRSFVGKTDTTGCVGERYGGCKSRRSLSRRSLSVEALEARALLTGVPVISEFMAANNTALADEDGTFADWIEIHNPDPTPLDLLGWHLTDNDGALNKWQFPALTLAAGQRLVVWASGKDRLGTGPQGQYHTNFSLSAGGEYLALVRPDGMTVAQAFTSNNGEYPQQYGDISYGLAPITGEEIYFLTPTPGAANGGPTSTDPARRIAINEIMYHPSSENLNEEYIELFNYGGLSVDVGNWEVNGGVNYTLPAGRTMSPGAYLVIAANVGAFTAKYPGVNPTIVIGGWIGQLSNRYETIELEDVFGDRVDRVSYADEGDWAARVRPAPDPFGHQGWTWLAEHDGLGKSLELVNPNLSNNQGQNWRASVPLEGTPGAANSVASANAAPLISDVAHAPIVPRSTDSVTVTAEIRDESTTGVAATLFWRVDQANNTTPFTQTPMFDDGLHGDAAAGDGLYGGTIPAHGNGTIVEYYVRATDSGSRARTSPGPTDAGGTQGANALYQVDNSFTGTYNAGDHATLYLIMREDERAELADIGDAEGSPGQPPNREADSNAQMNGTLISFDGNGLKARHRVGIRNRGGTTRVGPPNNYHVNVPKDNPWNGDVAITINAWFGHSQALGSAVFQAAGQPVQDSTIVQVRVNGQNLAEAGNRMFGRYVLNESRNTDLVEHHFPDDAEGNFYAISNDFGGQGDLGYRGPDPDAYRNNYFKQTNEELDNWDDLIHLTDVLNNAPDATYLQDVSQVADVRQWFRHLAIDTLLGNREGGLATGAGDDYSLYCGVIDPQCSIVPHDLDTLLGLGQGGFQPTGNIFVYENIAGLYRLLNHADTAPIYLEQLLDLLGTVFTTENINFLIDQTMAGWVAGGTIQTAKNNAAARRAYIESVIPTSLTVTSTLPGLGGFPRTTDGSSVQLSGTSHAGKTRSVTVNGALATWTPRTGQWSLASLPLHPGVNRLYVRAWDAANGGGNLIEERFIDVWYDNQASGSGASLTIPGGTQTTWRYLVTTTDPAAAWKTVGFSDASWPQGPAELGYGDTVDGPNGVRPGGTNVGFIDTDPGVAVARNITTYFRHTFNIPAGDAARFNQLTVSLNRDDGASVYINDVEVVRSNMPGTLGDGTINTNTPGLTNVLGSDENNFFDFPITLGQFPNLLHDGTNVIAVEVHQNSPISADVSFDLRLTASETTSGGGQNLSGTISTDRTLTASGGPYHVTSNVTVAAGATLTIQPGTSLFFSEGAQLTVNGRLVAEGNENNWIRFTREPNTTANWNGIQFNGTTQDNRLSYAILEWATTNQGMVGLDNSNLTIDHGYLDHAERRRIRSQNSSLVVRNTIFTDMFGPGLPPLTDNLSEHIWGGGIPAGGQWIVENNLFGLLKGHNDAIDFDAPPGAGAIQAQILGNTFIGSGDDFTDMTGNVYMEGNRFLNAHRDTYNMDPGQSNSNSSSNGDYTSVRNVYYNIDHATLTKETAFTTFENNTVVSSDFAAIYFDLAGQTSGPGRGGAVDGSIFYDTPVLFSDVLPTTQLSLNRSIVPTAADAAMGSSNQVVDPNFFNIAGLDFNLGPGSPARGTGPNGIDMGAMVPGGATIGGEPAAVTPLTTATLIADGPGIVSYRYRVNAGTFSAETPVATPISLSGLTNGTYTVYVVGKNAAGVWQADASATASKSWTVQTSGAIPIQVVINEILASNAGAVQLGATRPDVIELYNRGDTAVNLAGLGITDNPNNPAKFVFPAGTTIAARGYLLLYADSLPSQGGELHLGFGLDAEGDGVYLYPAGATATTMPLDSVEFGIQLANLSIGRLPGTGTASGTPWGLAQPTLGGANRSQALGDPRQLRINEWFTGGQFTVGGQAFTDDFIELYNPSSLPVGLGGLYLTDNPADDPDKFRIADLSYVAAGGYRVFLADENTDQGANHTSFQLTSERGWLGLFAADQTRIDEVLYPPMLDGTSQGRVPDGGPAYQYFAAPTPGLDSSPPSVPSNLHFTLVSPTRNDVGWDASTDSQTGVSLYRVYRGGLMLATTTLTTYSDTTVESGTSYSYQVSAVNGDGAESGLSAAISSGLDSSPPSTPTGLAGTIAGATQINLTWNASSDPQSGVRNYNVYRNGSLIGSPTTTAFDDTALAVGPTVTYRVSAINNDNIESPHGLALYAATFQDGVAPTAAYTGTADTWIDGRNPGINNGTSNFVRFDGDDVGQDQWALVKWDLAGLPADSTITAGAINIFVTNNSSGQVYAIYALAKNWVENVASFDVYATGQFWDGPGASGAGDKGAAILGTHTSTTLNVMQTSPLMPDGVAQLQAWRSGTQPNYGVIFYDPATTDGVLFNSREATQASTRPLLTVLYTTPPPLDTTPPSVPTNLVASNDGASRITLFWNAASDPDSGIASYNVYRGGVPIGSTTNLTFTDPGRTPGVNYSYTVSAINNVGLESGQSSPPVVHSIAVDSSPPSAPSGVAATDNGVSQITLTWTAATDAQSGISLYRVYRDGGLVGTSATTTFVDMGLALNVMYSYQVAAVNGQNLEGPRSTPAVTHEIEPLPLSLTLGARDSYLPGVPMLVRVEITGSDGLPDRSIWDATATLSSSNPAVTLSTTTVTLRNGVGSALVTPTGAGSFTLTASVPSIGIQSSKVLTSLAGVAQTNVSGTLTGAQLNWSGVIHVTGNVTVPDGQTLNIAPGTLVLVDGAPDNRPNLVTNGIVISVNGTLSALGTAARPITFTSTGPTLYWGEVNHSTSDGTSRYAYVDVLHAGHSPGGDHTGHGPAIRSTNSTLDFDHANITDIVGKTMRAQGSNLTFRNSIFARSAMGPETFSTGLLFENSYIFDMLHIYRQDNVNDDDDGIYVHRQGAGQQIRFDGCIVANTEDDGIDHLGADIIVENCIIRDMVNTADDPKGITIIEGTNVIRNTLMVNVDIGISAKGQSGGTPVSNNTLDHVTIVANSIAIQAEDKFGIPGAILNYDVKNSILRAPDAVRTDYDPAPIVINYSNLSETWPGTGNQTADPLFVSPAANDYRLQPASPAIDAGDPASPLDADGTRTDMGFFTYLHQPRVAEVLVRGTGWTPAMLGRLAADGLGSGGYRVPIEAGPNFAPLPWTNINQIVVRFTEGVSVAQNDLTLAGVNVPNYTFSGFAYDPATFTATWTRTTPIAADKLRLTANDSILDLTGSPLDGEIGAAYPSGNSSPGGDFSLRFDVLPGDANQNRAVDGNDFQSVLQVAFNGAANGAYNPRRDFDGNGAINVLDLHAQLSRQGTTLPAGNPPGSPTAPSAVVIGRTADPASAASRAARLRQSRPSAMAVDEVFSHPDDSAASLSPASLRARRGRGGIRLAPIFSHS